MLKIKTPEGLRHGQFLFNFLEWLRTEKGYEAQLDWSDMNTPAPVGRMADPFNISDEDFESLLEAYCDTWNS